MCDHTTACDDLAACADLAPCANRMPSRRPNGLRRRRGLRRSNGQRRSHGLQRPHPTMHPALPLVGAASSRGLQKRASASRGGVARRVVGAACGPAGWTIPRSVCFETCLSLLSVRLRPKTPQHALRTTRWRKRSKSNGGGEECGPATRHPGPSPNPRALERTAFVGFLRRSPVRHSSARDHQDDLAERLPRLHDHVAGADAATHPVSEEEEELVLGDPRGAEDVLVQLRVLAAQCPVHRRVGDAEMSGARMPGFKFDGSGGDPLVRLVPPGIR